MATTAPFGHIEPPFPVHALAEAAGASFVACSTVYHARELDRIIELALCKKGFSVVEAVSYCHTTFGRLNKLGTAVDMMRRLKEDAIPVERARGMAPEALEGKIVRGVLLDRDIPEFTERYQKVIEMAQAGAKG